MLKSRKVYSLSNSNLSISIPADLLLELNALATSSGFSRNKLINLAIEDLLKKERKKEAKVEKDFILSCNNHALNAQVDQ